MKVGVVIFPGSNCDRDTLHVFGEVLGAYAVPLWHKNTSLESCDMIILPGGFSYGDYLRSGAIAKFSPIMEKVIPFAKDGGLLLGICNGFQILCETGLLPGVLLHNTSRRFICKNVFIKAKDNNNALTAQLDTTKAYKIPIAHGEGRYFIDENGLNELIDNEQIVFQYCNHNAEITIDSNPNGALLNIAGICNPQKNIFGMMPHPERASEDILSNSDGSVILQSLLSSLQLTR